MQIPENILLLIEKYLAGSANAEEKRQLNEWYHSFNDTEIELIANENDTEQQLEERIKKQLLERIQSDQQLSVAAPRHKWRIAIAAAVIFLITSTATYFIFFSNSPKKGVTAKNAANHLVNDVPPGGNKAILTLANGSDIVLDSASNGTISEQGNINVRKMESGLLAYMRSNRKATENDEVYYNTITTPRGGQYQITLADGTKVWLNAASSIRFPVVFKGSERNVEITGEAYFEVAKNKAMPFKIKAALTQIEVVGTHFNVNAYNDEAAVKTTLLEGIVKISAPSLGGTQHQKTLLPGQQSSINKEGKIIVTYNADTEEAVAWKNGRFQFASADLKTIFRQLSRWYDVDIIYDGNVNLHFTGQLTRNANASKIFEQLALTNEIHFKIEGKKIIVSS